jgi:hypothetical protein
MEIDAKPPRRRLGGLGELMIGAIAFGYVGMFGLTFGVWYENFNHIDVFSRFLIINILNID